MPYLDTLGGEQRRGLAGTRDRLAILAESDVAAFLEPRGPTRHNLDLLKAVQHGDIVHFRLERETGSRSRGREFVIHPDDIRQLQTGWALVANPGRTQPKITRMLHPQEAQ